MLKALRSTPGLAEAIQGKVIYVLIMVVLVQSIYPITEDGSLTSLIIYQLMYLLLLVAGIVVSRERPAYVWILSGLGVLWLIGGISFALNQTATWAQLLAYGSIILFQGMVTRVLIEYVFTARLITRDVLYAACAIYLLLGAIFVPVYGIIETITFDQTGGQHAFSAADVEAGEIFPWQTFIYYSYVTLTTAGYGDILPVTMAARSAASLEAIIGVLYITVIMARLVGLYATREIEDELKQPPL